MVVECTAGVYEGRGAGVLGGGVAGRAAGCSPDGAGVLLLAAGGGVVLCAGAGFFSLSLSVWASRLALEANTRAATAARIQRLVAAVRVPGCADIASLMVRCPKTQSKSGAAPRVPVQIRFAL
jgi:hypothetical protein